MIALISYTCRIISSKHQAPMPIPISLPIPIPLPLYRMAFTFTFISPALASSFPFLSMAVAISQSLSSLAFFKPSWKKTNQHQQKIKTVSPTIRIYFIPILVDKDSLNEYRSKEQRVNKLHKCVWNLLMVG